MGIAGHFFLSLGLVSKTVTKSSHTPKPNSQIAQNILKRQRTQSGNAFPVLRMDRERQKIECYMWAGTVFCSGCPYSLYSGCSQTAREPDKGTRMCVRPAWTPSAECLNTSGPRMGRFVPHVSQWMPDLTLGRIPVPIFAVPRTLCRFGL